jgi:hypothetical protein
LYPETFSGIETGFLYARYDPTLANPGFVTESICVAVIDETSPTSAEQTADWVLFRSIWPDRLFKILQPKASNDDVVNLPDGYNGTLDVVSRDNGNVSARSDWYQVLNLDSYPKPLLVSLFIDNSGSMATSTVSASLQYFREQCAANEVYITGSVSNTQERYILPFANETISNLESFYNYENYKGRFYCALSNPWNKDWSDSLRNLGFTDADLTP